MSADKSRCGVDSSKCIDWTTTRRAGYKPGPNEPTEPQYTITRGFNGKGTNSKKTDTINKSGSKKKTASTKKSAVKTNKTNASSVRNTTSKKSKSIKRNINSNTSMTRTTAT